MKRNSLKQRNIINIMRSYGETQVLTTNSSMRVNFFDFISGSLWFGFILQLSLLKSIPE